MDSSRVSGILEFLAIAGRLKETERAGWALRNVPAPESVADHTFRMCLMALVLAPHADPPLDRARCMALALAHDLGESLVGDITPYDGVSADEKERREREAMVRLSSLLGETEMLGLWEEYQAGETAEARFVRDLDKLETAMQAGEYGRAHGADLREFLDRADERAWTPAVRPLYEALRAGTSAEGRPR